MGEDLPPNVPPVQQEGHIAISEEADAAQQLGEAAVDQVADPQEYGVDHSIDPATGEARPRDEEPATHIEDEAKAAVMAEAGDDQRTDARDERKAAADLDHKAAEILSVYDEDDPFVVDSAERRRKEAGRTRDAAAEHDDEASRREDWAGALHDHPPSEEYQAAHPEISFTTEGLMAAEELLEYREDRVEEEQDYLEDWEAATFESGRFNSGLLETMFGNFCYDKSLDELLTNPDATLRDLRDHFLKLRRGRLEKQVSKANALQAVLDDVRHGRTAEQQSAKVE